jgi:hypothetical protein
MTIAGDLESTRRDGIPKPFDEGVRGELIAFAVCDIENQLRVPFDGDERVAVAQVLVVFGTHSLFLLADEIPNLINFHVLNRHVADVAGHEFLALLASDHQELQNRIAVQFRDTLHAANTRTFQEHPNGENRLFHRDRHFPKRFFVRLSVRLPALTATEPAQTVAMRAETSAADFTDRAHHFQGRFRFGFHTLNIHQAVDVFKRKLR